MSAAGLPHDQFWLHQLGLDGSTFNQADDIADQAFAGELRILLYRRQCRRHVAGKRHIVKADNADVLWNITAFVRKRP